MKALLLLFLVAAAAAADLRLVGTNLYDFSIGQKNHSHCIYRIHGRVVKVYPQSIQVAVPKPSANLFYYSDSAMADAKLEGTRYYRQILDSTHKSSRMDIVAEAKYGSETTRELRNDTHAAAAWQQWEKTFKKDEVYIYVLNSPPTTPGMEFDRLALPTHTNGFFDCGIPFSGNSTNYPCIFVLQTNRITIHTNSP